MAQITKAQQKLIEALRNGYSLTNPPIEAGKPAAVYGRCRGSQGGIPGLASIKTIQCCLEKELIEMAYYNVRLNNGRVVSRPLIYLSGMEKPEKYCGYPVTFYPMDKS